MRRQQPGAFLGPLFGGFGIAPSRARAKLAGRGGTRAFDFGPNCPALSPLTPTDSDNDDVPDNVTETFNVSGCTDAANGATLSGSASFSDPTTSTADLDFQARIDNIVGTVDGDGVNGRLAAGGTASVAEMRGQVAYQGDWSITFAETAPRTFDDSLAENITATFEYGGAALLTDKDSLLPGTRQVGGTVFFTSGANTYAFTLATPTALTVDPTCDTDITAGVVQISFTGAASGSETITWTGCGAYTVSHS